MLQLGPDVSPCSGMRALANIQGEDMDATARGVGRAFDTVTLAAPRGNAESRPFFATSCHDQS